MLLGLQNFLMYCTGSRNVVGNVVYIEFTNADDSPSISVNTCTKTLTISMKVNPIMYLKDELSILINEDGDRFTMP